MMIIIHLLLLIFLPLEQLLLLAISLTAMCFQRSLSLFYRALVVSWLFTTNFWLNKNHRFQTTVDYCFLFSSASPMGALSFQRDPFDKSIISSHKIQPSKGNPYTCTIHAPIIANFEPFLLTNYSRSRDKPDGSDSRRDSIANKIKK